MYIRCRGIELREFHEPDLDNALTAIATRPVYGQERNIFKKFQLLKGKKCLTNRSRKNWKEN